jgi:DNA polymerase-1
VELNYRVAVYLKSEGREFGSDEASRIESVVQHLLENQKEHGFALNVPRARELFVMFGNKANSLESEILAEMPPIPKLVREVTPKYIKKTGALSKVGLERFGDDYEVVAGPHSLITFEEFNLNSPKQKVQRLAKWWSPYLRTKGYPKLVQKLRRGDITEKEFEDKAALSWRVTEENLATIPDEAPQVLKKLGTYAMYTSRYKEVQGWFDALGDDRRVHGSVNGVGAVTHRMGHIAPNTANIPSQSSPWGAECRECFTVGNPDTHVLLGCDASGIQLRVLAHYMNDPEYTEAVAHGDIHTKNLEAMGIGMGDWDDEHGEYRNRAIAKTFIYAWVLGAGDAKVGEIIGGTTSDGKRVKDTFLANTPSLGRLKEESAIAAKVGVLVGFDGRKLPLKSAHFALSSYLQGGESVIMKYAMILWHSKVSAAKLDARQVAVVHDEFQVEVKKEHADDVGEIIKSSIIEAGVHFKLRCPLDASYKTGLNWLQTH